MEYIAKVLFKNGAKENYKFIADKKDLMELLNYIKSALKQERGGVLKIGKAMVSFSEICSIEIDNLVEDGE